MFDFSSVPLILASASPRRRELLHYIKEEYQVETSGAEASVHLPPDTPAEEIPMLLARAKALDISRKHPEKVVIGADTVVISPSGEILGKPRDAADAKAMLRALSGATHRVVTGVCLCRYTPASAADQSEAAASGTSGPERAPSAVAEDSALQIRLFNEVTKVTFYPLSDDEIDAYVDTGEPMDKAGAYGIQGYGSLLAEKIQGDFFNVVGLPVSKLARELAAFVK